MRKRTKIHAEIGVVCRASYIPGAMLAVAASTPM